MPAGKISEAALFDNRLQWRCIVHVEIRRAVIHDPCSYHSSSDHLVRIGS